MPAERPEIELPHSPPPSRRTPGPTGTGAVVGFALIMLLAFLIFLIVLFGGWVAFACGVALMLIGVFALTRYVQRIAWTRRSPQRLRDGLGGMNEDLAISDEAHEDLSPLDFPRGSPAYRAVARRAREQQSARHRSRTSSERPAGP